MKKTKNLFNQNLKTEGEKMNKTNRKHNKNEILEDKVQNITQKESTRFLKRIGKGLKCISIFAGVYTFAKLIPYLPMKSVKADIIDNSVHTEVLENEGKDFIKLDANGQYIFDSDSKDEKIGHLDIMYKQNMDSLILESLKIIGEFNYHFDEKNTPQNWLLGVKTNFNIKNNWNFASTVGFAQNKPGDSSFSPIDTIKTTILQGIISNEIDTKNENFFYSFSLTLKNNDIKYSENSFKNETDLKVQTYFEKMFKKENTLLFGKFAMEILNLNDCFISEKKGLEQISFEGGFDYNKKGNGFGGSIIFNWVYSKKENTSEEENVDSQFGLDLRFKLTPEENLCEIEFNYTILGSLKEKTEQKIGVNFRFIFPYLDNFEKINLPEPSSIKNKENTYR